MREALKLGNPLDIHDAPFLGFFDLFDDLVLLLRAKCFELAYQLVHHVDHLPFLKLNHCIFLRNALAVVSQHGLPELSLKGPNVALVELDLSQGSIKFEDKTVPLLINLCVRHAIQVLPYSLKFALEVFESTVFDVEQFLEVVYH